MFSIDELISYAEPQDKLIMKMFLNNAVVKEYFKYDRPFDDENEIEVYDKKRNDQKTLYMRNKLQSSYFARVPGKTSINEFKMVNKESRYDKIDLSNCCLYTRDIPYIKSIVNDYGVADALIVLRCNRLGDNLPGDLYDNMLTNINMLKSLLSSYRIDITNNPIASLAGIEFIKSLNESELSNLIWISESWLLDGKWRKIFKNDSTKEQLVMEIHQQFYHDVNK
jgi:hypothetical protein